MNRHGDHIASCLCCSFLYLTLGEPGYSEWTPGTHAHAYCEKGHIKDWETEGSNILKVIHDRARNCKDFVPNPELQEGAGE